MDAIINCVRNGEQYITGFTLLYKCSVKFSGLCNNLVRLADLDLDMIYHEYVHIFVFVKVIR